MLISHHFHPVICFSPITFRGIYVLYFSMAVKLSRASVVPSDQEIKILLLGDGKYILFYYLKQRRIGDFKPFITVEYFSYTYTNDHYRRNG